MSTDKEACNQLEMSCGVENQKQKENSFSSLYSFEEKKNILLNLMNV